MSLFVKILGSREKGRKTRQEGKVNKFSKREELLIKKTEFLKKRIYLERQCAKKNCRTNRGAALQALGRKKWCEKHLNQVDCTVEAMRSAHEHVCSEIIHRANDLIKDITEKEDGSNNLNFSVNQKVEFDEVHKIPLSVNQKGEFDEDELLAELERLEKILDENLFEEDRDLSSPVLSTASASHPAKMEDEDEDDLEYLRHWANESLLEKNLDVSLFAEDRTEDRVLSSPVLSTSLPSHPAKLDEDEDEDDLEYLQRWVTERL